QIADCRTWKKSRLAARRKIVGKRDGLREIGDDWANIERGITATEPGFCLGQCCFRYVDWNVGDVRGDAVEQNFGFQARARTELDEEFILADGADHVVG